MTQPPETTEPDYKHPLTQDVRDAIDAIAKNDPDGIIETQAIVDAARDPESPLHRYFIWNDEQAAERYRLAQARALLGRYTITVISDGTPKYVNGIIRVVTGEEPRRGYIEVSRAVADPNLYYQIIRDAHRGIQAYRNRLSAFQQARGLVETLDEVLNQIPLTEEGQQNDD